MSERNEEWHTVGAKPRKAKTAAGTQAQVQVQVQVQTKAHVQAPTEKPQQQLHIRRANAPQQQQKSSAIPNATQPKAGATPPMPKENSAPAPQPTRPAPTTPAPVRSPPATWAALFGGSTATVAAETEEQQPKPTAAAVEKFVVKSPTKVALSNAIVLEPRGMVNPGTRCFLNVVLQSMVAAPQMCAFLSSLPKDKVTAEHAPILASMVRLFSEYRRATPQEYATGQPPAIGRDPIRPSYIYDAVFPRFLKWAGAEGQQDAQELFTFITDALHSELIAISTTKKQKGKKLQDDGNEGEWIERGDEFGESAISDIFFGKMRSTLSKRDGSAGGQRTVNIQPFQCLHLDIAGDRTNTVDDAVRLLLAPEKLRGYRTESGSAAVVASKSASFESLPQILCVHLKRFVFTNQGYQEKVAKRIGYGKSLSLGGLSFSLMAVVYHHGDFTASGHYTCDVLHAGRWWMSCNDASVAWIRNEADVLNRPEAYMLFYSKSG